MKGDVFIDTNILVYAHDRDAGERHSSAMRLIEGAWESRLLPWISMQVLQELHVNLVRKGIDVAQSSDLVSAYLSWHVIENTKSLFRDALKVQQRWKTSFWDASVIAAAQQAGATELWSEDLNAGQDYGGVRVVNPLRS